MDEELEEFADTIIKMAYTNGDEVIGMVGSLIINFI